MLAIVETGGKQYEVTEGRYVDVELLDYEKESSISFDKIVMIVAGDLTKVGQPYVEGAVVKATVLNHAKDKKVIVYKQRCKKGYRKKQGHRQNFTRVMINSIDFPDKETVMIADNKAETAEKKTTAKKTATKAKSTTTTKATTAKKTTTTKATAAKKTTTKSAAKAKKEVETEETATEE